MKVVLDIPQEFENHYNKDRFQDSLERIIFDIRSIKDIHLSGNYELEALEMFEKAFKDSWEIRLKHINDGIDIALRLSERRNR